MAYDDEELPQVKELTEQQANAPCACGHARRDHFPAADALKTGKVCTGRCKSRTCLCIEFERKG